MKTINKFIFVLSSIGLMATSCLEVETLEIDHVGGYNTMNDEKSDKYYADLRAYKAEAENYGRPVAFGWYSNWSPSGPMRKGYLSSMPDSVDIVSMWSGAPTLAEMSPAQIKDKEFVQKVKGTKLLEVSLLSHLGKGRTPASVYEEVEKQAEEEGWSTYQLAEAKKYARWDYWGFTSHDLNNQEQLKEALSKFAKALCDHLFENDWDGFDIDWEPGIGFNDSDGTLTNQNIEYLVMELGKYIGPNSDPEGKGHKLLCIDGLINYFGPEMENYVDYWIVQAYGSSSSYKTTPGNIPHKLIITENFEAFAGWGGQLLNQAAWMPSNGRKGGVGAFRFDNDYDNSPDYKWMRKAIQINQEVFQEWEKNQNEAGE